MINIDKGVPIPDRKRGHGRLCKYRCKYPWRDMEVGDSFVYEGTHKSASAISSYPTKVFGMKFSTRKEGDKIRIWRIA